MPTDYENFWHLREYLGGLARKQWFTPHHKKWWLHSRTMYMIFFRDENHA